MKIAILAGGDSSEHKISVNSGKEIQTWLKKAGYESEMIIIKGNEWLQKEFNYDFVWNIIHGNPGENGLVQAYLEMLNIPHNTSDTLSAALTFNKYASKVFLKEFDINTAEAELVRYNKDYDAEAILEKVGLPCFVKPNNGGSSFGTSKVVHHEDLQKAINEAFKEDSEVIIESFVKGRELTCGLAKTDNQEWIFPLTEIISENEFFDYEAKYEGKSSEITPADLDSELTKKCQKLASKIYDLCNCKGLVRVDFIIRGNQLFFLELNAIPGMTKESIVPQQMKAQGLAAEDLLSAIIQDKMKT